MPTKPTKSTAAKAVPPGAAEPARDVPGTKAVRSQSAAAEPESDGEAPAEQAPLNRAERRAKGRGKSVAQVPGGRGKVSGGHGPAHTQRNWASRRSG